MKSSQTFCYGSLIVGFGYKDNEYELKTCRSDIYECFENKKEVECFRFFSRDGYETLLLLTKELMLYDSTLLRKPSILILNKVENDESQRKAEEILNSFEKRIIPRSIQDLAPFEFPQFQETMKISAKERINLEKVAEVFRSELDRIAVEQEIEAGGEMMSPEERRERLGFELSHGIQ